MARSAVVDPVHAPLHELVAVLHDGPLAPGPRDLAFDASALAPGAYVVVARVTAAGGQTWTEARRITVAR